jgi:D-alanyl-lipoteichoic acid acyltransferase DltB (MBOAT superfamily)
MMGFVFPQNFRSPYRATGLRDFWRRWHMSLSRFLRDFLYIPLGGSRGGRLFTYRNLFLTMLLGGLWHGAAWTFVLWGALHGGGLVAEHAWHGRIKTPTWLRWLVTFNFVVLGWILFRSQDLATAGAYLGRFATWSAPTLWTAPVLAAVVVVIGLQLLPARGAFSVEVRVGRVRPILLGVGFAVLVLFVAATVPSQGVPPFIYFRF